MLIAVDFDGVISHYKGFQGRRNFEPPVAGVAQALATFQNHGHKILINTTRLDLDAVEQYLIAWGIPYDYLNDSPKNREHKLHPAKQMADVYIDDRSICFQGSWDEEFIQRVLSFKPWWKKEK